MGSKGIKRRKPRRPLPKVRGGRPISDADEPPIMWPSPGSGFQADPFSPTGTAQREWFLIRRLGQTRYGKPLTVALLAVPLLLIVIGILLSH
jgi:hypothetical protein